MKSIKFSLFILGAIFVFSSCKIGQFNHKAVTTTSFTPQQVRLNLTMNDFEYLGESEIYVSEKTYLGIFTTVDSINGGRKEIHYKKFTKLQGNPVIKINRKLRQATYKVVEQYPEADYFVLVSYTKEVKRMFLGSKKTYKAVIKAYKLKVK